MAGGINTYAYVGNNPISFVDPMGLFQFATRPLSGLEYEYNLTNNNIGFYHEHGFYQDGSGDNIGFFKTGVGKDPAYPDNQNSYNFLPTVYDGQRMRRAQKKVASGSYDKIKNNCQDYADKLRVEYRRLEWMDFMNGTFPNIPQSRRLEREGQLYQGEGGIRVFGQA